MGMTLEKAFLYERCRLPYALEAVDDLLQDIGGARIVADVGAGTGQLARLFAGRGETIYCVEPDPAMRLVAAAALSGLPAVELVASAAENTALPMRSVDLIVMGNAFHRFRPEACVELRRILKPGGWIALFSYRFTNQAFTDLLFPRLAGLEAMGTRIGASWHRPQVQDLFGTGQVHFKGELVAHDASHQ